MTDQRLDSVTTMAIAGADRLTDSELAVEWHRMLDRVIIRSADDHEHAQNLCELAALAMVTARRITRPA